jgi:RNA polymerase sigma-70 factor (ECF subfamily)
VSGEREVPPELGKARERFLELVSELRPELHRYCARIVGSVVDGEDIVQEALARAFYAVSIGTHLPPLRAWLFRIGHNTAIDFLRRYERKNVEPMADPESVAPVAEEPMDPEVVRAALTSFLALPVSQRCAVILKDVLDHSLAETADTMGTTIPAVKAALFRGRAALRARRVPSKSSPFRTEAERSELHKLQRYAALFNARDWGALQAQLAEECRLDLVGRADRRGKEVGEYFTRYAAGTPVFLAAGAVEGKPALLASSGIGGRPEYFILLHWSGDRIGLIRDFRYVPYIGRELNEATIEGGIHG